MTTKNSTLRLDKEFGVIEKIVPQTTTPNITHYSPDTMVDDIEDDYKYQRDNFYNLVEKGSQAIDGILELAKESEHPRTYEVAGQLIKSVAEVAEKLGDLQEKMRKLKEVPNNAPKNVTNALFVGSTKELQKMLKDNIEDENT
jgi:DNA-binding ferritin-like protein